MMIINVSGIWCDFWSHQIPDTIDVVIICTSHIALASANVIPFVTMRLWIMGNRNKTCAAAYVTLAEANAIWEKGYIYDERIYKVILYILEREKPMLIVNRNPTLNFYSILLMKIRNIIPDKKSYAFVTMRLWIMGNRNKTCAAAYDKSTSLSRNVGSGIITSLEE